MTDILALIVSNDEEIYRFSEKAIRDLGYNVITARNKQKALNTISNEDVDLIISDIQMPQLDGETLLEIVKRRMNLAMPVIIMNANGLVDTAVRCMKLGAFDYLNKNKTGEKKIQDVVKKALADRILREDVTFSDGGLNIPHPEQPTKLIGATEQIQEVFLKVARLANSDVSVLITGETGTGKELIVQAIHYTGRRKEGPFVIVNCAAIPETLLESELFGHERGTFTDAVDTKIGKFEHANKGTIFLDEMGEASSTIQVKLLRVLQDHVIERVGGLEPIHIDVRVIAATNADLEKSIQEKTFRQDLYYRLNVVTIHIPPLRERKQDIPDLAKYLLRQQCEAQGVAEELEISSEALDALIHYDWPGNIRELDNVITRCVALREDTVIHAHDLNLPGRHPNLKSGLPGMSLKEVVQMAERSKITEVLQQTNGNKSRAARLLNISYRTLLYKVKEYQISSDEQVML